MTYMATMPIHVKNFYKSSSLGTSGLMALKFEMLHWAQEWYQNCLNNDLGLFSDKIAHVKILEHKISLKLLMLFVL